jgi:hypothetical protein
MPRRIANNGDCVFPRGYLLATRIGDESKERFANLFWRIVCEASEAR